MKSVSSMSQAVFVESVDRYGNVHITLEGLVSAETFATQLDQALPRWADNRHKLAWLRLTHEQANCIPHAIACGFQFHQVQSDDLALVKQLVEGAFVPSNASHTIGAGGLVINHKNELLTIVEQSASRPDYFKLPGGTIDEGEHLAAGVMREVLEETGIRTAFESIVFVRQTHNDPSHFGKSNFYIICRLRPLSAEITLDPIEIAKCQWMPVEQYLTHPSVADFEKMIVRAALATPGFRNGWLPSYTYRSPDICEFFAPPNVKHFKYET